MIFLSTACLKNKFIKDSVREIAEFGLQNIELSGGTKYYADYLGDLISLQKEFQLNYVVHNFFPPPKVDFVLNLASQSGTTLEKSVEQINKALEVSKKLNVELYSFHPGYSVEVSENRKGIYFDYEKPARVDKAVKEEMFYRRLDEIIRSAPEDVLIAVENLFPFNSQEDYSLLSKPDEIIRFLNRYAENSSVGLLLDLGHLNVASHYFGFQKRQFIETLFNDYSPKIFEIHLSENDGSVDYHGATPVKSWQIEVVRDFAKKNKNVPITFEWHGFDDRKAMFTLLERIDGVLN